MADELTRIAESYKRRKRISASRYSRFNPEVLATTQERQRAVIGLLKEHGFSGLEGSSILEIGCGSGGNLLELLLLGASPELLVGNELLADRVVQARRMLPSAIHIHEGDASSLPFFDSSFDIVYQSTVFSSILNDGLQQRIATAMWRWVRPGGGILWYDFIFDNPSNPDVRGVRLRRIRALFPDGIVKYRRVTLAPPLARRVARLHPWLYGLFNGLPFLRTHVVAFIQKAK